MQPSSDIEFSKWHGLGNDYIILEEGALGLTLTPLRAAVICDRHFGIGSDGILLWGGSEATGFRLEIFNPDGSQAEMCGNGMRILAGYLSSHGNAASSELSVTTAAGVITPAILADGQIRVHMGRARLGGPGIAGFEGVRGESEAIGAVVAAAGRTFEFTFVSMGNPHCVIESDGGLDNLDLELLGGAIETNELFPGRTNVEFMRVLGPSEVEMRVWERGTGETNACGTGACAVAVAACRTRDAVSPVTVHLPGGDLVIEVDEAMEVYMTGPASEVYTGTMSEDFVNMIKEL